MDPLAFVFAPGAAVIIAVLLFPIGLTIHNRQLRRGQQLNGTQKCGRCANRFDEAAGSMAYVIEGVFVCGPCAHGQRRRLFVLLPLLLVLVAIAGVSSVAGVILGGMELDWWLNSRLIPLFASVVGFGLLSWGAIRSMKSANLRSLESMTQTPDQVPTSVECSRLTTGV